MPGAGMGVGVMHRGRRHVPLGGVVAGRQPHAVTHPAPEGDVSALWKSGSEGAVIGSAFARK